MIWAGFLRTHSLLRFLGQEEPDLCGDHKCCHQCPSPNTSLWLSNSNTGSFVLASETTFEHLTSNTRGKNTDFVLWIVDPLAVVLASLAMSLCVSAEFRAWQRYCSSKHSNSLSRAEAQIIRGGHGAEYGCGFAVLNPLDKRELFR